MAARQRLRAVLDARRASQPCWRCALNLPRYNSTSTAGILDSSKSTDGVPYGQILQQGSEDTFKSDVSHIRLIDADPVPRITDGSEIASTETPHKPRIRVQISEGQPVALGTQNLLCIRKHKAVDPIPLRKYELLSKPKRNHVDGVKIIRYKTGPLNILYLAKGHDATQLVRKDGPPLGECPTYASEVSSKGQREDEAFDEALTSLLDASRDHPTSKPPTPTRDVVESTFRTHFAPQDRLIRQAATSSSRVSNRQAPIRHYATATVSE